MKKEKIKFFIFGVIVSSLLILTIIYGSTKITLFSDWLMSFLFFANKTSIIAEWFSAIGTVSAVIVALLLSNKEYKSKLNFYLHSDNLFIMNSGRGYTQIRISSIRVIDSNSNFLVDTSNYSTFCSVYSEADKKYLTINPGNSIELLTFDLGFLENSLVGYYALEIVIEDILGENIVLRLKYNSGCLTLISGGFSPIPVG